MAQSSLNYLYAVPTVTGFPGAAAPLAATFTGTGVATGASPLTGYNWDLDCDETITGAGSLSVVIQRSNDGGTTWITAWTFATITLAAAAATCHQTATIVTTQADQLRVVGTVTGAFSTPDFTVKMSTGHDQWRAS